ncbi:MAG TPA: tripartite tricarboxylate transporter substrate binding protein [Ramlibacter sp.]|nr:tripartite tricarboxylate transporter substrate binding protein [Ramlibacter sp.]
MTRIDDTPNPTRRRLLTAAALMACGGLHAQPASNVARIIVPFAAGGAREMPARIIQQELGKETGLNWIIESKPGAGGAIGTVYVGQAAPDGMTLLMAASSHFVTAAMGPKPHYDAVKDFVPVANIGDQNYVLIVQAGMRVNSAAELIALARKQPGGLNYGSAGVASSTHLAAAYFCGMAGIQMVHVPFKSTQEAANDVVGGRIHAVFVPTAGAGPYLAEPRVKVIGITAPKRSALLPNVPAIAESGLKGYEFESWFGLLAPGKTPPAVVAKLNAAVNKVLGTKEIKDKLVNFGIEPKPLSPTEFNKLFLADRDLMARIVKESGITRE